MPETHPGRDALCHVARVLEQQPRKDDHALSFATQSLAAFREELIHSQRCETATDADRQRLARLNAIIAVVMGMHFPLGHPPWGELDKARGWLAALVEEIEPVRGSSLSLLAGSGYQ